MYRVIAKTTTRIARTIQTLRRIMRDLRKKFIPVALPPGRARVETRPRPTGSALTLKTIGMVAVAAFAAAAATLLAATITLSHA